MKRFTFSALCVAMILGGTSTARSTLNMTWNATTTTLTSALTGAPANSPVFLVHGNTLGSTSVFHGNVLLGINAPVHIFPMGLTDANGDLNGMKTFNTSPLAGVVRHFQAVTVDLSGIARRRPSP